MRKNRPQPAGIWFSMTSDGQSDSARQISARGLSVPLPSSSTSRTVPLRVTASLRGARPVRVLRDLQENGRGFVKEIGEQLE